MFTTININKISGYKMIFNLKQNGVQNIIGASGSL